MTAEPAPGHAAPPRGETAPRADDAEALAGDVARLEALVAGWDEDALRLQAVALRNAVERLHAEALRRMLRALRDVPGALAALRSTVEQDAVVRGVLAYHGLLKPPVPALESRVADALASVRPSLAAHGGDVELVAIAPPEVRVRLLGSCVGCPASMVTLVEGVERAVKERCPEVERVVSVSASAPRRSAGDADAAGAPLGLVSPFALVPERGWARVGPADAIPEGGVRAVEAEGVAVLLARVDGVVHAYPNACAHLGMPLDGGEVAHGVITCPFHGFRYALDTGECLTAPAVALPALPVRVRDGEVRVRPRG